MVRNKLDIVYTDHKSVTEYFNVCCPPLAIGHFLDIDQLLSVLVQVPKQETVCEVLLFLHYCII